MARRKKNELRCRVTMHLQGGARPGDVVVIDPTDAWMLAKIRAGALAPLDPNWAPAEPEPAAGASEPPGAPASAVPVPAVVLEGS